MVKGKVLSISVKISKTQARKNNAKVERKPGKSVCLEHDVSAQFWVKSDSDSGAIISLTCDDLKYVTCELMNEESDKSPFDTFNLQAHVATMLINCLLLPLVTFGF